MGVVGGANVAVGVAKSGVHFSGVTLVPSPSYQMPPTQIPCSVTTNTRRCVVYIC